MKKIFITLFIFISLPLYSDTSCYQTLLINNQKVESGPISWRNLSTIERKLSSSFYDLESRKPLNTFLLVLFTGFEKPWYGYHSFVAFTDVGVWKRSTQSTSYFIDQDVLLEENYRLKKVDHRLQLDYEESEGFLTGKVSYQSIHRQMSGEKTFKLKKVSCPNDMP